MSLRASVSILLAALAFVAAGAPSLTLSLELPPVSPTGTPSMELSGTPSPTGCQCPADLPGPLRRLLSRNNTQAVQPIASYSHAPRLLLDARESAGFGSLFRRVTLTLSDVVDRIAAKTQAADEGRGVLANVSLPGPPAMEAGASHASSGSHEYSSPSTNGPTLNIYTTGPTAAPSSSPLDEPSSEMIAKSSGATTAPMDSDRSTVLPSSLPLDGPPPTACLCPTSQRRLSAPAVSRVAPEYFAGCLLTMDDNHRLVEWLAYHYHSLPLRRLIVMVDPRSSTSPRSILARWKDYMEITLWTDDDVLSSAVRSAKDEASRHRARQRMFNVQCMRTLRDEGAGWTLMTDVDEYLYINPLAWGPAERLYQAGVTPISIAEPGSVLTMLGRVDLADDRLHAQKWRACLPVARLQFGGTESPDKEVEERFPTELEPTLRARDLDTFRWRYYGVDNITTRGGLIPGKTIVDLTAVPDEAADRSFSGNPHRPIDTLCPDVWLNNTETLFVANHVLGTKEQYAARDDARSVQHILAWERRKNVGGNLRDAVRPWLAGFVKGMGTEEARRLLTNAGQVQVPTQAADLPLPRCSINFFGLPRSFETMALPSIVKNILLTNAKYHCDIFVHYYKMDHDEAGRFNRGGAINAEAVHALKGVVEIIAARAGRPPPSVVISGETEEEFLTEHGDLVHHYRTAADPNTGKPIYFPWADKSYTSPKQLKNIVMQWHSIQSAWEAMAAHADDRGITYQRVAFFRSDAFYALPIDLYQTDKDTFDYANQYAVVPAFAKHPVNDRMIYGPAAAVKIWATERFKRLERHVATYSLPGYGMHSERYLEHAILPAIEKETGYKVVENMDICFYRTRASDSVLITDCSIGGSARNIEEMNEIVLVENLVNRPCRPGPLGKDGRSMELLCDDSVQTSGRSLLLTGSFPSPPYSPTYSPNAPPFEQPPGTLPSKQSSNTPSTTALPSSTGTPSKSPSISPSKRLTQTPSTRPSAPSSQPSAHPSVSEAPSSQSSMVKPIGESSAPTSSASTTFGPSSDSEQSNVPTSSVPTKSPIFILTDAPTESPTDLPSDAPTESPTHQPTDAPTASPTVSPTDAPTTSPTLVPVEESSVPSVLPSVSLSAPPSDPSSVSPTLKPSPAPTCKPKTTKSCSENADCACFIRCKKKPSNCKCLENKCRVRRWDCATKGWEHKWWKCGKGTATECVPWYTKTWSTGTYVSKWGVCKTIQE